MKPRVTRLAPSPTGALHLGNLRTFLLNWALARRSGWQIVLRIEDLDGPRIKPEAATQAIDLFRWLGIDWDRGPIYQSRDRAPYEAALTKLADRGLTYRCPATRREILAAASAPHEDDHEQRYPGLYRPARSLSGPAPPPIPADADTAVRLIVPDGPITFTDIYAGPQSVDVQQQVGDFILHTKAGLPSYQLAVVVDDARQGVTDVVRGDDLLRSSARQVLLYQLLDLGPPPRYYHLPLVYGRDGHRLAKRHGDTRAAYYRERGCPAEKIIGLIAYWSGLIPERAPMTLAEFLDAADPDRLPPGATTFTTEDDAWLLT
jgi:glutamyl-tRNA synthetase